MPIATDTHVGGSKAETTIGPSDSGTLRHDLRTFLNHIIGYSDLVGQDAPAGSLGAASQDFLGLASEAAGMVEHVSGLRSEEPGFAELCSAVHSELTGFGLRVISITSHATEEVNRNHADDLLPDLARVHNAAVGLIELAGTLVEAPPAGLLAAPISKPEAVSEQPTLSTVAKLVRPAAVPEAPAPPTQQAGIVDLERAGVAGSVLVVDDNAENRDILRRYLKRDGLDVECAEGGREGLDILASRSFDLVLLDLLMPEVDGFEVLRRIKSDRNLEHLPVVVLSAVDELPKVLACIEAGAEDYLSKPINPILMRSRVQVLLERKRLQEEQRRRTLALETALSEVEEQKRVSEALLSNILPNTVAEELRTKGSADPMYFEDATIVLTDFVGFTASTEKLSADELVEVLHNYFTAFDQIMAKYGLEKLKTIGDSYMFVSGLPERRGSHPVDAVMAALEMVHTVQQMAGKPVDWKMRVGVHTGPVIAGVVGIRKFAFDVWGESVNLASRMESSGAPNRVNVSERTYARVKDFFTCEPRGKVKTKEGREMEMYFVNGIVPKLLDDGSMMPPRSFSRRYKVYFQNLPAAFPEHLLQPAVLEVAG